jgi:hypothetical protein
VNTVGSAVSVTRLPLVRQPLGVSEALPFAAAAGVVLTDSWFSRTYGHVSVVAAFAVVLPAGKTIGVSGAGQAAPRTKRTRPGSVSIGELNVILSPS